MVDWPELAVMSTVDFNDVDLSIAEVEEVDISFPESILLDRFVMVLMGKINDEDELLEAPVITEPDSVLEIENPIEDSGRDELIVDGDVEDVKEVFPTKAELTTSNVDEMFPLATAFVEKAVVLPLKFDDSVSVCEAVVDS